MKKGQILENITIETVGFGGVGVGVASDGRKVLVKGSVLPHSTIDCVIFKVKKDYIIGLPLRVQHINPEWANQTPPCSHYSNPLIPIPDDMIHKNGCGGCKWQLLSYNKQLELKTHLVKDSFRGVSYLLDEAPLENIIPSPIEYHYRNKIEFSFGKYITKSANDRKAKQRRLEHIDSQEQTTTESEFSHFHDRQLGFHKQGSYNHVIDVDQCYLISQQLHEIYLHLKQLCQTSGLPVYDQKRHTGILRHIVMREGHNTGDILINLVIAQDNIANHGLMSQREQFRTKLVEDPLLREKVTTCIFTNNSTVSDAIRRADTTPEILWGDGYIFEELQFSNGEHRIKFRISPFSFFQTNTRAAQNLFSVASNMIKLDENKQVIMDLYCGAGTIGLSFLSQGIGQEVIGIEIVEDAIHDARYNANLNGLGNHSYFVAGKTEDLISSDPVIKEKIEQVGLILVDPPREGLHKDVCVFLNELRQRYSFQLIYISCNPVTLARDLDLLKQGGWTIETLQPVDLFPQTHHVEMISVLR